MGSNPAGDTEFGGLAEWLRRRFRKPMGVKPSQVRVLYPPPSARSLMDRASVSGTEGCAFESHRAHSLLKYGCCLEESRSGQSHTLGKREPSGFVGSNPTSSAKFNLYIIGIWILT